MRTTLAVLLLAGLAATARADNESKLQGQAEVDICNADAPPITVSATPTTVYAGGQLTIGWSINAKVSQFTVTDGGSLPGTAISANVTAPAVAGAKTYSVSAQIRGCANTTATGSVTVNVLPRKKIWLEGSRYSSWDSVYHYMDDYTLDQHGHGGEGSSTYNFIMNSGIPQSQKDAYSSFCADARAWPASAAVHTTAHQGGTTYMVDENGNILGSFATTSIFDNGLPGLSYLGNPWGNGDYNKVFVGDANFNFGGSDYEVLGFVSVSPIILDMDGDGKPDVDRGQWLPHQTRFNQARAKMFDINATGFDEFTEWIGPKDGLLVTLAKNGTVKGENLFGNPIGYVDGYQKLGLRFDKDKNGVIEGDELQGLYVWQDLNQDGKAQPNELKSVQELGITQISTKHDNLKSTFVMNGKERATWDWWPTCMLVYPKPLVKAPSAAAPKL